MRAEFVEFEAGDDVLDVELETDGAPTPAVVLTTAAANAGVFADRETSVDPFPAVGRDAIDVVGDGGIGVLVDDQGRSQLLELALGSGVGDEDDRVVVAADEFRRL